MAGLRDRVSISDPILHPVHEAKVKTREGMVNMLTVVDLPESTWLDAAVSIESKGEKESLRKVKSEGKRTR